MVAATEQVNWAAVVQACARQRCARIADMFWAADLSHGLIQACNHEEELQVFTEADLEAIRAEPFDNVVCYDYSGDLGLFKDAVKSVLEQLLPVRLDYDIFGDVEPDGYYRIFVNAKQRIGQNDYQVRIYDFCGKSYRLNTWGDALDQAYRVASEAAQSLEQWSRDRLCIQQIA